MDKAQNATSQYNHAQIQEQNLLNEIGNTIDSFPTTPPPQKLPFEDNLVDYWSLSNSLDNKVEKSSYGALQVKRGNNVTFSNNSAHLSSTVLCATNYRFPEQFTITLKYKPDSINPWTLIFGKQTDYSTLGYFNGLFIHNKLTIGRLANGTTNPGTFDPTIYLSTNSYSTIAISFDGEDTKLYINGNFICQTSGYSDLNSDLVFGGSTLSGTTAGGPYWGYADGYFKDIAIYNRALTNQEISLLP